MDSLDRLAELLKHTPFDIVEQEIYNADLGGSYTFNRMNPENEWRVSPEFEYIIIRHGWSVEEFNKEYQRKYDE